METSTSADYPAIPYHVVPIPKKFANGKELFRVVVDAGPVKPLFVTAHDLREAGCLVSEKTLLYSNDYLAGHVVTLMSHDGGCPRSLGPIGTLEVCIGGSLASETQALDPVKNPIYLRLRVSPAYAAQLAQMRTTNTSHAGSASHLYQINDPATGASCTITGKNPVELVGVDIMVVSSRADEGVYLQQKDGTPVAKFTVVSSTRCVVTAGFSEAVADGEYLVCLKTRGNKSADPAAPVQSFFKAVTVQTA